MGYIESDKAALNKLLDDDESLQSFYLNYNEEESMSFALGKTSGEIFPLKIGQIMKLVSKNLDIIFKGDTAYGTLIKSYDGVLLILASNDSLGWWHDSLDLHIYDKLFSITITRNIIFVKVDNSDNPLRNWKIDQVSLPVRGTLSENIKIENLKVFLPNSEVL